MNKIIKLVSWNINGLRSLLEYDISFLISLKLDFILLQEVRTGDTDLIEELKNIIGMKYIYYHLSFKSGHAGVAILTNHEPIEIYYPNDIIPSEGRILIAEYNEFILLNLYSPYIGYDTINLKKREKWEKNILDLILTFENKKLIIGGDLNVAPTPLDRHRVPKKQPGCNEIESQMFMRLLQQTMLIDSFRELHPEDPGYTWGLHQAKLRLDYFLVRNVNVKKIEVIEASGSDLLPLLTKIEI